MSDYTPNGLEFIDTYVSAMSGGCTPIEDPERTTEARRGINKVKADALREAANALPKPVGLNCKAECHTADWASLQARADRIESGDGQ